MSNPINQFSFSSGELSPQLWDRVDMAKYHSGAALMENFFVDFRGGASNRPGTKYVLQCPDSTQPSRLIPFTFSTLQTYALCFGLGAVYTGSISAAEDDPTGDTRQIVITVPSTAGMMNGNKLTLTGTVTNGQGGPSGTFDGVYPIEIISSTQLMLIGSAWIHPYVSGGTYVVNTGELRFFTNGAPVVLPANSVTAITTASPGVLTYALVTESTTQSVAPSEGDTVYLSGIAGMPRLQERFAIVTNLNTGAKTFELYDLFGNPIDTTDYGTYTGGGSEASVYTLPVPYDPNDLAELKFTQSADVMTFTHNLYQQAQLTRTQTSQGLTFTYEPLSFAPSLATPTGVAAVNTPAGGTQYNATGYYYGVTAVNGNLESEMSTPASVVCPALSENLGAFNTVTWTAETNVSAIDNITYNVYRTQEALDTSPPSGSLFGYIGSVLASASPAFTDNNIAPDFTRTPPMGYDPFPGTDFPGCTTYFQGRQVYAGTEDEPDRLVMSRSGDYTNMDYSNPSQANDSIDVTIEATQVNAIEHLVPLQVLLALTSSGLWRIDTGDTTEAMTPSNVMARPQNSDGCSNVPPIVIDYEILFVQNLQSTVRAIKYDFLLNLFRADNELTILSNHLVFGYTITEWAYAQQPFRLIWCVRDDGIMLSLTYMASQNLCAWTRHVTQGQVKSICMVVEGSENAIYLIVQRLVQGQYVNYVERMASRMFSDITQAWFVDAGLSYGLVNPAATATPSAKNGKSTLAAAANVVFGGQNYSALTTASVIDLGATADCEGGSGSSVSLTIESGVITAAACTAGSRWIRPQIVVTDPTGQGSGAVLTALVQQLITLTASAAVFDSGTDVGKTVRINGGVGTVVAVNSTTQVTVNLTQALTSQYPCTPGNWSCTMPVTSVSGLDHLEGCTVACLANGGVQPQQVVEDGTITLTEPADAIVVGLPYTAEIDTLYMDIPGQEEPTIQGKRKKLSAVTLRLASSRGMKVGPLGQTLYDVKDRTVDTPMGQPQALFTGDHREVLDPNFNKGGQLAIVQSDPLPCTVLGFMPEVTLGDE